MWGLGVFRLEFLFFFFSSMWKFQENKVWLKTGVLEEIKSRMWISAYFISLIRCNKRWKAWCAALSEERCAKWVQPFISCYAENLFKRSQNSRARDLFIYLFFFLSKESSSLRFVNTIGSRPGWRKELKRMTRCWAEAVAWQHLDIFMRKKQTKKNNLIFFSYSWKRHLKYF